MSDCYFCGNDSSVASEETYDQRGKIWPIRRCVSCGAHFLSPGPTQDELATYYSKEYYGGNERKFLLPFHVLRKGYAKARAQTVVRHCNEKCSILDVGCGTGEFLQEIEALGASGSGIEREEAAARARKLTAATIVSGDVTTMDLEMEQFDAICLWHVFEHLPNAKQTLVRLIDALKTGGFLFLSLPNIDSFQAKLFGKHWFHWDPPRHLFLLGRDDLVREVRELGLELCHEKHFLTEYNPFGYQQSLQNMFQPHRREQLYERMKGGAPRGDFVQELLNLSYLVPLTPFAMLAAALESCFKRGGTFELGFRKVS